MQKWQDMYRQSRHSSRAAASPAPSPRSGAASQQDNRQDAAMPAADGPSADAKGHVAVAAEEASSSGGQDELDGLIRSVFHKYRLHHAESKTLIFG